MADDNDPIGMSTNSVELKLLKIIRLIFAECISMKGAASNFCEVAECARRFCRCINSRL